MEEKKKSSKVIIAIVLIIVAGLIFAGGYYFSKMQSKTSNNGTVEEQNTSAEELTTAEEEIKNDENPKNEESDSFETKKYKNINFVKTTNISFTVDGLTYNAYIENGIIKLKNKKGNVISVSSVSNVKYITSINVMPSAYEIRVVALTTNGELYILSDFNEVYEEGKATFVKSNYNKKIYEIYIEKASSDSDVPKLFVLNENDELLKYNAFTNDVNK